jgi:hypothetical protein
MRHYLTENAALRMARTPLLLAGRVSPRTPAAALVAIAGGPHPGVDRKILPRAFASSASGSKNNEDEKHREHREHRHASACSSTPA